MNTISKSKLKAHMLEIFRDLEKTGRELIVTDRNRPVLRIVPIVQGDSVQELFGDVQCRVVYHRDLNETTEEDWDL